MVINPAVLHFAFQRQEIYLHKLAGDPVPELNDPILRGCRFTNVYRAADRVSQYLIREVHPTARNAKLAFYQTILFKIYNNPDTWEYWKSLGMDDPYYWDLDYAISKIPASPFRGAYMNSLPGDVQGYQRPYGEGAAAIRALQMVDQMLAWEIPELVAECRHSREIYHILRGCSNIGPFLGYQLTTDLGYSQYFKHTEDQFVVAGPGSEKGVQAARTIAAGEPEDIIREVQQNWLGLMAAEGLPWRNLFGREPQLIDVQNVFCEYFKFYRAKTQGRMPRRFQSEGPVIQPVWPEKWGIPAGVWDHGVREDRQILAQKNLLGQMKFRQMKPIAA